MKAEGAGRRLGEVGRRGEAGRKEAVDVADHCGKRQQGLLGALNLHALLAFKAVFSSLYGIGFLPVEFLSGREAQLAGFLSITRARLTVVDRE